MSDYDANEEDVREYAQRIKFVYIALAFTFCLLFGRLWFLQIIRGEELHEFSLKNKVKENRLPAPRGLFYDRDGRILVDNVTGYDCTITPQYASTLETTAEVVGDILGVSKEKIINDVKQSRRKSGPFFPVVIKENLSIDEVFKIQRQRIDHPGLDIKETILRYYPLDEIGAQLFGYVGEISKSELASYNAKNAASGKPPFELGTIIGKSGLEEIWDSQLRGKDGLTYTEVDAHGRKTTPTETKVYFELKPQEITPGDNLILTIDKDIQEAAYKAMLEQNDATGPRIGGVVAMRTNGEILAWVNTPSFNPNRFARGISSQIWSQLLNDPYKPLRNKVIQDHYAPGSTLKPIIAAAALQEGEITPNKIINAPGQMRFGNRLYHDSLRGGHGDINVKQAIERSSNIFFYKMGIALGIDRMAKYAQLFRLGQRTGIDLKNEAPGLFPTKEWKEARSGEPWQPGENLSNAIGQGFVLTNVLQMALAYNAIATDGKLVKPMIVHQIQNGERQVIKEFKPEVVKDITVKSGDGAFVSKETLKTVREGMRMVANGERGTARWWKIPGIQFAGKTGTSQIRSYGADEIYDKCEKKPLEQRHHGSFVGYAPAEQPEIVVAALTEHACHGNTGAVPVVRDIMLAYFQKYRPDLIKTKEKKIQAPSPNEVQPETLEE